jgi:hypothetical protein
MRRLFSGRDAVVYRNLLVLVTVAPPVPLAKLSISILAEASFNPSTFLIRNAPSLRAGVAQAAGAGGR